MSKHTFGVSSPPVGRYGPANRLPGFVRLFAYGRLCPFLEEVGEMAKGKGTGRARSAISGRYVTKATAKRTPKTTVVEKSKRKGK